MTREALSRLDDWELVHDDQDIRGWPVVDDTGTPLGTVTEMIVDTDEELVDSIVVDGTREIPASDIRLADGKVWAGPQMDAAVELPDEQQPIDEVRRDRVIVRRRAVERE